jgi:hypothetical protein
VPLTTCRRGTPFLPPNQLHVSNLASNSHPKPRQTATTPILPALFLIPLPLPEAFLITPTPFNLHKCLPTGGFLQTAVSDAPHTTSRTYLRSYNGASDTALAFLANFRLADHKASDDPEVIAGERPRRLRELGSQGFYAAPTEGNVERPSRQRLPSTERSESFAAAAIPQSSPVSAFLATIRPSSVGATSRKSKSRRLPGAW